MGRGGLKKGGLAQSKKENGWEGGGLNPRTRHEGPNVMQVWK